MDLSRKQQVDTISTGSPRPNILVKTIAQVTLSLPAARCALSDFQVANHCAAIQSTHAASLPSTSIPNSAIPDLIQYLNAHSATAKALAEEHQVWMADCWPSCRYKTVELAPASSSSVSPTHSGGNDSFDEAWQADRHQQRPRTASYYSDVLIAGSWSSYRAYRILLYGTIKRCHDRIAALGELIFTAAPLPTRALATTFHDPNASTAAPPDIMSSFSIESSAATAALPNVTVTAVEEHTESSFFCKGMIDDILASVPFCLGNIDSSGHIATCTRPRAAGGYGLLFPLGIVARSPFAPDAQGREVKAALEGLGIRWGSGGRAGRRRECLVGLW